MFTQNCCSFSRVHAFLPCLLHVWTNRKVVYEMYTKAKNWEVNNKSESENQKEVCVCVMERADKKNNSIKLNKSEKMAEREKKNESESINCRIECVQWKIFCVTIFILCVSSRISASDTYLHITPNEKWCNFFLLLLMGNGVMLNSCYGCC